MVKYDASAISNLFKTTWHILSSSSSNLKWISFISCLACSLELTSRPSRMAFHVSFRRLVLIISVYMCVVILKREKETKATQILLIWVIWCTIIIYLLVGQAYKFARVGWWHIYLGCVFKLIIDGYISDCNCFPLFMTSSDLIAALR